MTTEQEILSKWLAEKVHYDRWGKFVSDTISNALPNGLLRIECKARTKDDGSLIQKALYRGKQYKDPYNDIEDKVGVRFVVLKSDDIPIVEEVITGLGAGFWTWEKDRDFLEERSKKPWEFGYQSTHYVVRSKIGLEVASSDVPSGIPCEIQVRTLLQHAFSEITHDTIYKPSVKSTPEMMRAAAKSMALIEATDDYFLQVSSVINDAVKSSKDFLNALSEVYVRKVGKDAALTYLDGQIIEEFFPQIGDVNFAEVSAWLDTKPYVFKRISEKAELISIFRSPSILLLYYIVGKFPNIAVLSDLLTEDELLPIYVDLGQAMPSQ